MTSTTGVKPPLHRRFDQQDVLKRIRWRYQGCQKAISEQIEALQLYPGFRKKCQGYYKRDYKDWILVSAIMQQMYNTKARELGLTMGPDSDRELLNEVEKAIHGVVYPISWFLGQEFDLQIDIFNVTCLHNYGFRFRKRGYNRSQVERFLRERMRHFDFDFPHKPLFGDPPGDWPQIEYE